MCAAADVVFVIVFVRKRNERSLGLGPGRSIRLLNHAQRARLSAVHLGSVCFSRHYDVVDRVGLMIVLDRVAKKDFSQRSVCSALGAENVMDEFLR
jgi:hypothetical protein